MAYSPPTTQQVSDNLIAAIEAAIGKSIPLLPKSFTRVLSKALGGVFILVYKYAGFSLLQMFVQFASFRETTVNGRTFIPLVEWGRLVGVGDPVGATNATVNLSFAVVNADSTVLPAGTQLVHPGSGVIYITLASVTLDASTKTAQALAVNDPGGNRGAGTVGNRDVGDLLKWANPIPQLSINGAAVTGLASAGGDAETEAAYRQRVIDRMANRPQGGAYADYVAWGLEEANVINIYPYTGDPGEVDVYVEVDEATDVDGIPDQATLDAVAALIQADENGIAFRRPVSSLVNTHPITRQGFDVEILSLVPDDADTKAVIEEALDDYFRGRAPFIVGVSKLPRLDRVTEAAVGGVVDEAASALGATVISVTLNSNGSPTPAWVAAAGQKAKLASTTYI